MIHWKSGRQTAFISLFACLFGLLVAGALAADQEYDEEPFLRDRGFDKQRITVIVKELNDPIGKFRLEAIEKLTELGPEARIAIPRLIELLEDETVVAGRYYNRDKICDKAANCLIAIGPEAVMPLSRRFAVYSAGIQERILFIARRMGFKARGLLPAFVQTCQELNENEDDIRRGVFLSAIATIEPSGEVAVPILTNALQREHSEWARSEAAEMLNRSEYLEQVYWRERAPAAIWYRNSKLASKSAVDALLAALKDSSKEVRAAAALSISTYPEAAKQAIPQLIKLLDDPEFYSVALSHHVVDGAPVAGAAATALSRFHHHADEILPPLIKYVGSSNSRGIQLLPRYDIFGTSRSDPIADLVVHSREPMKRLEEMLNGTHPELALVALARQGLAAGPLIPRLKTATVLNDLFIPDKVHLTLAGIDPDGQARSLQAVRRFPAIHRYEICQFLEKIGPHAAFTVPLLQEHLLSKDELLGEFDENVLAVLAAIGPDATPAAPIILEHLGAVLDSQVERPLETLVAFGPRVESLVAQELAKAAKSPKLQLRCLTVLKRLKSGSAPAVSAILAYADSQYPLVRGTVAEALGASKEIPATSRTALERLIADPRPLVRASAIESCGGLGAAARSIIPTLITHLSDDYLDVRVAAATALGRIGTPAAEALPELKKFEDADDILLRDAVRIANVQIERR